MNIFPKAGPSWSGFFLASVLALTPFFTACQSGSTAKEPLPRKAARTDGPTRSYLGLSKQEAFAKAREMGLRSRLVREDFERFPMTKDLRADRINFEMDKGRITSAKMF